MKNKITLIPWYKPTLLITKLGVLSCFTLSCASMGFTDDTQKLIKTVSFDQNCPIEKVQLQGRFPGGIGVTKYKLKVCGKTKSYVRLGGAYFESGKEPGVSR